MTDDDKIKGRARIAHEARKSERTITRWVNTGVLAATKAGPFENNLLEGRRIDMERVIRSEVEPR